MYMYATDPTAALKTCNENFDFESFTLTWSVLLKLGHERADRERPLVRKKVSSMPPSLCVHYWTTYNNTLGHFDSLKVLDEG